MLARDGELYLIEMGARMGGNGLAELVHSGCGVDLEAASIALAVGEGVVLEPTGPRPAMVHVFAADRGGQLVGITGLAEVRALPEVVEVRLFAEPGCYVRPYAQAGYKLGYAVLASDTAAGLHRARQRVRDTLRFLVSDQDMAVPLP